MRPRVAEPESLLGDTPHEKPAECLRLLREEGRYFLSLICERRDAPPEEPENGGYRTSVAALEPGRPGRAVGGFPLRVRHVDRHQLAGALARAGLSIPPQIHVTLIPEHDPRARATPIWIVGHDIAIFPERIGSSPASYPYDSLESVVWHEVVHRAPRTLAAPPLTGHGGRPSS